MGVKNNIDFTCYENLANAIVRQAAVDYQKALCEDNTRVIKECKRFFNSNWYRQLTTLDGKTLMRMLEIEASEMKYDWKAIRKAHCLTNETEELID